MSNNAFENSKNKNLFSFTSKTQKKTGNRISHREIGGHII